MSLNFIQVRQQVSDFGKYANLQTQQLQRLSQQSDQLFIRYANDLEWLHDRVARIAHHSDPALRCALPINEPLNSKIPLLAQPGKATILAVDGSQVSPDRHLQVNYGLINVGAIAIQNYTSEQPATFTHSHLLYGEDIENITEASLALQRDLAERRMLAELAQKYPPPVFTFTDGPLELWGSRLVDYGEATTFQKQIEEYLVILKQLHDSQAITAGYIDKPAANLVVRLLEVALSQEQDWRNFHDYHPLRGVTDRSLLGRLLGPGERSAIFGLQSQSSSYYQGEYQLHFFYLNVSSTQEPSLARVEIPAWVSQQDDRVAELQAVLVQQCRLLGNRPYPYALHRAHETAVVNLPEKEQVTQMIVLEMVQRGLAVGKISSKQTLKDLPGRHRHQSNI